MAFLLPPEEIVYYYHYQLLRLGDTIQNIDISILNSRYLESIPIFKIKYQHRCHNHAYFMTYNLNHALLLINCHMITHHCTASSSIALISSCSCPGKSSEMSTVSDTQFLYYKNCVSETVQTNKAQLEATPSSKQLTLEESSERSMKYPRECID